MAEVRKKISPDFFKLILAGKKKFELRLADFDIKEGDTLVLEEWTDKEPRKPTGRTIEKRVHYLLEFDLDTFGQREEIGKKGLYVIQFD